MPEVEEGSEPEEMDVPACPRCGALLRPDVVWFGEAIPADLYALAEEAACQADVCFVIGTSSIVYPAAALPDVAQRNGALLVEINPEPTPLTKVSPSQAAAFQGVRLGGLFSGFSPCPTYGDVLY
jgi:NAD-dependent deacetylase